MKTSLALILAFLITFLIALNFYYFNDSKSAKTVIVKRVIDGDTLETADGMTIRLLNINTPEKSEFGYSEAKSFLSRLENRSVEMEVFGVDKYSRILARIYAPEYINLEIVKRGLGKKFLVQESELKPFSEAEKSAIENSIGIWQHSRYYDCFTSKINPEQELVHLENSCPEINLNGWIITDESRKRYKFPDISIEKVNLHTKDGEDNTTDLYWRQKQDVWNNNRDSLYLLDSESKIAHYNFYGYDFLFVFATLFRT